MSADSTHNDDFLRRANLRVESARCRELWASVVLNEMSIVSLDFQKMMRDERVTAANHTLGNLRRWLNSKDGREVLELAGIAPSDRAVANILRVVESGKLTREDYMRRSAT